MNRIGYYVFRWYAVAIKLISQKGYDKWIVRAHKKAGVIFIGSPEYIDSHSHLDIWRIDHNVGGSYFY